METIELNGKKYVTLEEHEIEIKRKEQENPIKKAGFVNMEQTPLVMDNCKVIGIGTVELTGNFATTRVSYKFLQNALNCLKALDKDLEAVDIALGQDYPLVIGERKGNKIAGVIIAPRIKEEE